LKIYQLDEDYASQRKKIWPKAFRLALIFIGVLWAVFLIDNTLFPLFFPFNHLKDYGVYPRQIMGFPGIFTTVFLHGSLSHVISNTLPLLLAITALFGNYPKTAKRVFVLSILLTGILVWSFARSANHIGASGLLYCLLTYIFISGFIKKDIQSIGISFVIAFLYGSLIFGIIPDEAHISWESHLFGLFSGLFLAWYYRHDDKPIYKSWDEEE
jgi:membrane associated rhomboid family serine protease